MAKYKGNRGNLMQHWTLCELLVSAGNHASGLSFIDAHAMAPLATENKRKDKEFVRIQDGLPGRGSVYEQAWHTLDPNGEGYPNSAAFVREVWEGQVSMLLCEIDKCTVTDLKAWALGCAGVEIAEGDWRETFKKGLQDAPLALVSFDPYMYNKRREVVARMKEKQKGNLYPEDIEWALDAMSSLQDDILIQLSTYDANDGNRQEAVISSVDSILAASAFTLCAVVRVNEKMMSLVYARNVPWSAELANLPDRFKEWLSGF